MSIEKTIEEHWGDITRKREAIAEALSWSATGVNLSKESEIFSSTPIMQNVLMALSDPNAMAIDQFKISQYFAQALQGNPEENIKKLAKYLGDIAKSSEKVSPRRTHYYIRVKDAVESLQGNKDIARYSRVYMEFQNDQSKEAILARHVMTMVSDQMRKIMAEFV